MKQSQGSLDIHTGGYGLIDVTARIEGWLREQSISTGLLTVFIRHTSASLTISENADPDVLTDLESFFKRTVPENPQVGARNLAGYLCLRTPGEATSKTPGAAPDRRVVNANPSFTPTRKHCIIDFCSTMLIRINFFILLWVVPLAINMEALSWRA
jgi:hypothetical protein